MADPSVGTAHRDGDGTTLALPSAVTVQTREGTLQRVPRRLYRQCAFLREAASLGDATPVELYDVTACELRTALVFLAGCAEYPVSPAVRGAVDGVPYLRTGPSAGAAAKHSAGAPSAPPLHALEQEHPLGELGGDVAPVPLPELLRGDPHLTRAVPPWARRWVSTLPLRGLFRQAAVACTLGCHQMQLLTCLWIAYLYSTLSPEAAAAALPEGDVPPGTEAAIRRASPWAEL